MQLHYQLEAERFAPKVLSFLICNYNLYVSTEKHITAHGAIYSSMHVCIASTPGSFSNPNPLFSAYEKEPGVEANVCTVLPISLHFEHCV